MSGIAPSTLHPSGTFSSYITVKPLDSIGVSVLLIFSFIPFISLVTSSLVLVLYRLKLSIYSSFKYTSIVIVALVPEDNPSRFQVTFPLALSNVNFPVDVVIAFLSSILKCSVLI